MRNYLNLLQDIMDNGTFREEERTGIGTKSLFGCTLRFDLSQGFPLLTTKRMFFRGVVEELLWFLRGETDSKTLEDKGVNIWRGNTTRDFLDKRGLFEYPEGEIGVGYGWQWRNWGGTYHSLLDGSGIEKEKDGVDQIAKLIHTIKTNPQDRRMLVSSWNVDEIDRMALPPCFPVGTPILTERGYIDIENIRIGDNVLSHKGTYNPVTDIFKTPYQGEMLRIKRNYGLPVDSTPNHPFLVRGKGWVEAKDIQSGDYLAIPRIQEEYPPQLSYTRKEGKVSLQLQEDDFFFFGYFMGKGWINHDLSKNPSKINRINVTVHKKYQFNLIPFFESIIGNRFRKKKDCDEGSVFETTCDQYGDILRSFGNKENNKNIPSWIIKSPIVMIRNFLEGYVLAKGCIQDRELIYCNPSRNLSLGLQMLHLKVGEELSVSFQEDLYLSKRVPERLNKTSAFISNEDGVLWTRVLEVCSHPHEGEFVYNLSVENTHTYTVWNTATHNCHYAYQCYVDNGRLSLMWNQRSVDSFLGLPFNIASYATLVHILAKLTGLVPGDLIFVGGDVHLYNNHISPVKEQLSRTPYPLPTLHISKELKTLEDMESLKFKDFEVINYQYHPSIKADMAI